MPGLGQNPCACNNSFDMRWFPPPALPCSTHCTETKLKLLHLDAATSPSDRGTAVHDCIAAAVQHTHSYNGNHYEACLSVQLLLLCCLQSDAIASDSSTERIYSIIG